MALGFVEDRDTRLDLSFVHQPGKVLGRALGAVGGKPRRRKAEALLRPVEHGSGRAYSASPGSATGLNINDDGVIEVDQLVGLAFS